MPVPPSRARSARTALLPVVLLVLVSGLAGCTNHDRRPAAAPSPSATVSSAAPSQPASVPLRVRVTRVLGRLPERAHPALEANVGKAIGAYLDGAFLSGTYPRSDFSAAFAPFTRGAAVQAHRDTTLLTNASYGATTTAVRATRSTAYLSVLAPNKVAAGVTARVDLVMRVDRGQQPAEQVRITGRMLLTRNARNDWTIFGYQLARSDAPAGGGS